METRTLTVWDGEDTGAGVRVPGQYRAEYQGPYLERYEPPTAAMKANRPEWKALRVGLILDAVKGRAAVFRQAVASRRDATPTDLVIGPGPESAGSYVLQAWSTDPQHADPPGRDAPCVVWDFTEREPTEDEKRILAAIRRGPPPAPWTPEGKALIARLRKEKETAATSAPRAPVCRVHFIEREDTGDKESILDVLAIERPERRERIEHQNSGEASAHVEWHTIRDLRLLTATECISIMHLFPPENHPDELPAQIIHDTRPRNGEPFNGQVTFAPDGKPRLAGGPGGKLVVTNRPGEFVLIERGPLTVEQRRAIGATPEAGNAAAPKEAPAPVPATFTIRQAAEYARVDERTIRAWLKSGNGDKPMLPGVIGTGRMIRIPRAALDPWRKPVKGTKPPRKPVKTTPKPRRARPGRKTVKRKS